VVWKPEMCIHSAKCVHGLPGVFKPKEKPWIQIENGSSEELIKTIDTCPSGALSYYKNSGDPKNSEEMSETKKVEVIKDGPLMVFGDTEITHDDGRVEVKKRSSAFCRCGKTQNGPFCDGSHKQ